MKTTIKRRSLHGVDVMLDGEKIGTVVKTFRYGYYKVVGFKTLYTTQREAIQVCVVAAQRVRKFQ